MFLRVSKAKSRSYVVIVRGYRDQNGKVKQKTIKNLGSFTTEEEKIKLYNIGRNLINHMDGKAVINESTKITEVARLNWGANKIITKLIEKFELDKKFKELNKGRKIKFNSINILKFLIIGRLLNPKSKLGTYQDKNFFEGIEDGGEILLHNLYRFLDELANHKEEINEHIFQVQKSKIKNIDIILFDVTTLYFESKNADSLREFGFSKDCKFNEVQIVLSMMVTPEGRPLGYEIFPGNSFEGNTILSSLKLLKEKYNISKVTIVADRGMSSLNNLEEIKKAGFDYIIAFRIRSAKKDLQNQILDNSDYQDIIKQNNDEILKYKILSHNGSKLLSIYSSKRARKDMQDRQKLIEKATILLSNKSYKRKVGGAKYLVFENQHDAVSINHNKIAEDSKYDGYYAISYSNADTCPDEVINAYHDLWRIEESFRTMKHFLQARPMFHWSENRIIGHILLNYISLVFEKELELETGISQNEIRKAIYSMQFSNLDIAGTLTKVFAPLSNNAQLILDKFGLKH